MINKIWNMFFNFLHISIIHNKWPELWSGEKESDTTQLIMVGLIYYEMHNFTFFLKLLLFKKLLISNVLCLLSTLLKALKQVTHYLFDIFFAVPLFNTSVNYCNTQIKVGNLSFDNYSYIYVKNLYVKDNVWIEKI